MFRPVGIFLLSLFMYSQVYNTSVWVNYELNIDEITEAFCVNTDKPELNCHGTCHLKKQLIQADESNPQEPQHSLYLNEIQLFSSQSGTEILEPRNTSVTHQTNFEDGYSFFQGLDVFHPPKA